MGQISRLIHYFMRHLRVIAPALLLVGALTGVALGMLGRWSVYMDVFSHLTWHLLGAACAGLAALAWRRRAIMAAGLVALATLLTPTLLARLAQTDAAATAAAANDVRPIAGAGNRMFKVLELNSWHRFGDVEAIAKFLKAQNADFVLLSEVGPPKLKLLELVKLQYPYQADCARIWYCSLAVLSKAPLSDVRVVQPGPKTTAIISARTRFGGRSLTLVTSHIYRPTRSPRRHRVELDSLIRHVRKLKGRVLVAGDFNATGWSQSLRRLQAETGLTHMGEFLPTWPAWPVAVPQFAIDHIFVSAGIAPRTVRVGPGIGSDHLPLIGWFEISG